MLRLFDAIWYFFKYKNCTNKNLNSFLERFFLSTIIVFQVSNLVNVNYIKIQFGSIILIKFSYYQIWLYVTSCDENRFH